MTRQPAAGRPSLVLVHSFPTNSILLAGLLEYLSEHFDVHFIDLPGFTRASPAVPRPTVDAFARHLEERIGALDVAEYFLGGISFGYLVVSRARVDERCLAVLAMEPFLGVRSLHMRPRKRRLFAALTRLIVSLGLSRKLFLSRYWTRRLLRRGEPAERVETLQREVDPETFFRVAAELVTYDAPLLFHPLPHVLLVNPSDATINAEDVSAVFRARLEDLLIVETTVDHYPKDVTRDYFAERIPPSDVERILEFLNRNRPVP